MFFRNLFGKKEEPKKKDKIGKVDHYFPKIKVAVVRFSRQTDVGTKVRIRGATTDFTQTIKSMEHNHKLRKRAKKREKVGIKVKKRVRGGDIVYIV